VADAEGGWNSSLSIACLAAGVVLLLIFVGIERRCSDPLLPLHILVDRTRGVSLVVILLVGAGMFALYYFLSLYVQQVLGYTALQAGCAFLPLSVGIAAAAALSSTLTNRFDPQRISGPGALLAAGGMWGFTRLTPSSSFAADLLPWLLLLGAGLGLTYVPLILTAVAWLPLDDSGVGAASFNTAQQMGGAVGLAALTTVFTHSSTLRRDELSQALVAGRDAAAASGRNPAALNRIQLDVQTAGSTTAFLVAAVVILGAALLTLAALRARRHELTAPQGLSEDDPTVSHWPSLVRPRTDDSVERIAQASGTTAGTRPTVWSPGPPTVRRRAARRWPPAAGCPRRARRG
jgi:hypothetical protein